MTARTLHYHKEGPLRCLRQLRSVIAIMTPLVKVAQAVQRSFLVTSWPPSTRIRNCELVQNCKFCVESRRIPTRARSQKSCHDGGTWRKEKGHLTAPTGHILGATVTVDNNKPEKSADDCYMVDFVPLSALLKTHDLSRDFCRALACKNWVPTPHMTRYSLQESLKVTKSLSVVNYKV